MDRTQIRKGFIKTHSKHPIFPKIVTPQSQPQTIEHHRTVQIKEVKTVFRRVPLGTVFSKGKSI